MIISTILIYEPVQKIQNLIPIAFTFLKTDNTPGKSLDSSFLFVKNQNGNCDINGMLENLSF